MTKTPKLRPCEWCGREPEAVYTYWNGGGYVAKCGDRYERHRTYGPVRKTIPGAIRAWNEKRVR